MTKQEFIDWATRRGWQKDKFGHLQKTAAGKEYRYRLSDIMARLEVKVHFNCGDSEWKRIFSGYFKDLKIVDNKIAGMKR